MKIFVKYMVSLRCKLLVASALNKLGIQHMAMDHGLIEIPDSLNAEQRLELKTVLRKKGMELLDEKLSRLIENTTDVVADFVRHFDELKKMTIEEYVGKKINWDPANLSTVFAEVKGISLSQFVVFHKIELIKELLLYDKLTLNEIATKLGYDSVSQLTYQLKKLTGLSPSYFKQVKQIRTLASRGQPTDRIPKNIAH
jgi:AraC-like DNA-binding protein